MIWKIFASVSCVKMLFIPAYKSTDFEVHRNWLAITYSLPISKWYYEKTSEWTLDYPPLFAWFEYILSHIAYYFDKNMLNVNNLNYKSNETVLFQRFSVIVCDLLLLYGCKEIISYLQIRPIRKSSKWKLKWTSPSTIFCFLVLANVGLLLVDHIHFQYNGFLLGILLLSIGKVLKDDYLSAAFWFTLLLNLKHIFLYMAPAFGIFFMRNYCYVLENGKCNISKSLIRILLLGSIVVLITGISFGPFIFLGQTQQLLSRLFPFKRGLCHAYWAPNFWSLYNLVDKFLQIFITFFFKDKFKFAKSNMTSGLVQRHEHSVLPSITPTITLIMTIVSMLPCLWKLIKSPGNPLHFVRAIVICSSCSFLFGWHVHEKAILMVIIPLSIMAVLWRRDAEVYTLLTISGHYSLLPLIFTSEEFLIKMLLFILSSYYLNNAISDLFQIKPGFLSMLNKYEKLYILGLVPLFIYENLFQGVIGFDIKYPFLPLMMTSCYSAIGIVYSTLRYYLMFLSMDGCEHKQKTF